MKGEQLGNHIISDLNGITSFRLLAGGVDPGDPGGAAGAVEENETMIINLEIKHFVERYPWTFAKTSADRAPHEYYVKQDLDPKGQEDFERFVIFIWENGFDATFWGKIHTYYDFEGRYYWTMGAPIEETYILNRCDASEYVVENGEMRWKKACGESKEL